MFEPLFKKEAEPPPPKGVSSKEWDKQLQKGPKPCCKTAAPVALIRKVAEELGPTKAVSKLAFEELTGPASTSTEDLLRQEKLASVADEQLLKIAMDLNTFRGVDGYGVSIDGALQTYEDLGGKYKQAFGQPMFNPQQMAGSPALAGGTAQRAAKPTISMQQAQPTQSPATASPRAQAQTVSTPSAPAQTQAPSAAPAAASTPAVSVSMG